MKFKRASFQAVYLKGVVYAFGGISNSNNVLKSVEKYSPFTNKWSKVADMFDNKGYFCVCAFINKIYVFGAYFRKNFKTTYSCLLFNTKNEKLKVVANMNETRKYAACVVFQGNIVVSGGGNDYDNRLNTVEAYDVFANKWTSMPNTINLYAFHNLVVVKNKMFVIGQGIENCESFDNACKKFVVLKHQHYIDYNKSVSIGNRILIFQRERSSMICYDVDKDEWSEESFELTKYLEDFSCVKIPLY